MRSDTFVFCDRFRIAQVHSYQSFERLTMRTTSSMIGTSKLMVGFRPASLKRQHGGCSWGDSMERV